MRTARLLMAAALLVGGSTQASAQNWFYGVAYQTSLSVGATKDFVSDFSFRNFAIEARGPINPKISGGLYLAWNVLHTQTDEIISFAATDSLVPVDVSGDQFRTVNAFPIMAQFDYYFNSQPNRSVNGRIIPSVGLGIGTYYDEARLDIGNSRITSNGWRFGLAPNVQLSYGLSRNSVMFFNARFNWGTKRNGNSLTYFTFGLGFAGK